MTVIWKGAAAAPVERAGGSGGKARLGECAFNWLFPSSDVHVLRYAEEVHGVYVRLSECGVDPDELVMRVDRARSVLDPGSKKGQFRESVDLHAANVAEPTESLPH